MEVKRTKKQNKTEATTDSAASFQAEPRGKAIFGGKIITQQRILSHI